VPNERSNTVRWDFTMVNLREIIDPNQEVGRVRGGFRGAAPAEVSDDVETEMAKQAGPPHSTRYKA
jgi:hypothetical protein